MFRVFGRKRIDPNSQIPYTLYEALQQASPRRRRMRAILEVVLVAALVVALAFGTAAIYKHLSNKHSAEEAQTPTTEQPAVINQQQGTTPTNSQGASQSPVTQPPQDNKKTPATTTKPTETSESHTTNSGTVPKPQ